MSTETNDRELLELAAKAAGVKTMRTPLGNLVTERDDGQQWNPLADDGDALRLAVVTGLIVDFQCPFGLNYTLGTGVWRHGYMEGPPEFWTAHGNDAGTASRYTIVRAAAETRRAA